MGCLLVIVGTFLLLQPVTPIEVNTYLVGLCLVLLALGWPTTHRHEK